MGDADLYLRRMVAMRELSKVRPKNRLSRDSFYTAFRTYISPSALTNDNVRALARGVNYKSAREVRKAIQMATMWLRSAIRQKRYAVLIQAFRGTTKSSHWMAAKLARGVGRLPSAVVPYNAVEEALTRFRLALHQGVRTFVALEDGSYSGSDLVNIVTAFGQLVKQSGNVGGDDAVLYVAVGFASQRARSQVARAIATTGIPRRQIHFYAPKGMTSVRDFVQAQTGGTRNRLSRLLHDNMEKNKAMTIMAHKVPNSVSVPNFFALALASNHPSPYQDVRPPRPLPPALRGVQWPPFPSVPPVTRPRRRRR